MPWKVKLTIFKPSGKYYTDGEYVSEKHHIDEIFEEVKIMTKDCRLPGLRMGSSYSEQQTWMVLISVPEHPHDHPHIIVPHLPMRSPTAKMPWEPFTHEIF